MTAQDDPSGVEAEVADPVPRKEPPAWFNRTLFFVFFWIMVGISVIYGVRLWNNEPVHPSFLPVVGAAFAASLAFTIILVFDHFSGKLVFGVPPFKVEGASGPNLLWCVCFLSITVGLNLLGFGDAVRVDYGDTVFEPLFRVF